ncbi:fatty acyl-AMP ligase [Tateyamaria pelophila]|uniref:fatty acyl-AMP ligase n=1 Tax=Tateyamaria pelophila TaxID=328415 RepID=UPI001CBE24D1|nr:fatty acyl-AMP ligase [Tateyamaria pelophila]
MTKIATPTPTDRGIPFKAAGFRSFPEALDYAAQGDTGVNFFTGRGEINEVLPYRDLRLQSLQLAQQLIALGLEPGDRVAIIAESDGDFLRVFAACQYASLIPMPVPLPAAFRGRAGYVDQTRRMIAAARAKAAFGPAEMQSMLLEATADLGLKFTGTVAEVPALQDTVILPDLRTDGLAYLQFSSGSTRAPMGVAVTHDAFIANTAAISLSGMTIQPEDRCTTWLPFYHDLGLVGCLLTPIVTQMSIDIIPTRDFAKRPMTWLSTISTHGGTLSFGPTFGYELCVRRAERTKPPESLDLSKWRAAGIGGDMVRPSVLESFSGTFAEYGFRASSFSPSYGMAEAVVAISFHEPGKGLVVDTVDLDRLEEDGHVVPATESTARVRSFVRCGKVLPGHELQVRDGDGNVLPDMRVGCFFLRGPSMMQGYDGLPEETAAVLAEDGWLNTGDLGYLSDGEIAITGRAKDLIIINGRNIWPQDLEWSVEREVSACRTGDVAAFSLQKDNEEVIVLLVQCRATDTAAREALRAEVENVVSGSHGVHSKVVLVPHNSLPHTSSGKLSRTKSRQQYLDGIIAELPAPQTP